MKQLGTHTLIHPIVIETRDGDQVREEERRAAGFCVVMRRPKAKDLKVIDQYDGRDVEGTIALIARLSTLDDLEVDNLDAEDFEALGNLLDKAKPSGPPTGEMP